MIVVFSEATKVCFGSSGGDRVSFQTKKPGTHPLLNLIIIKQIFLKFLANFLAPQTTKTKNKARKEKKREREREREK